MLDSLFTTLFNTHLGPYVENLDGSQLRLKLFTGTLTLRNIVIRPDALETLLDLPLRVVAGTIGTIHLDIPLASLRSKPIIVQLDEVYVLAAPRFEGRSVVAAFNAAARSKSQRLLTIEKHHAAAALPGGGQPAGAAGGRGGAGGDAHLLRGMLGTILANLQVRVTRLHVRYEHPLATIPPAPLHHHYAPSSAAGGGGGGQVRSIVLGLALAELLIRTTNGKWETEFVKGGSESVHKLGSVQGLSAYVDTLQQPLAASVVALLRAARQQQQQQQQQQPQASQPHNHQAATARGARAGGGVGGAAHSGAPTGSGGAGRDAVSIARQMRALAGFGHVFEAQSALGQIDVAFPAFGGSAATSTPPAPSPTELVSDQVATPASSAQQFRSRRGSGAGGMGAVAAAGAAAGAGSDPPPQPAPATHFARRSTRLLGDARAFNDAYAYVLKPLSLVLRVTLCVGYPLDAPKASCSVGVDEVHCVLADRQYAMLLRVLTEHAAAWEARGLGLPWLSAISEASGGRSDATSASADDDSSAAGSSDEDGWSDTHSRDHPGAQRGGVSAAAQQRSGGPAASRLRHAPTWRRMCRVLVARYRALLRERERHAYLRAVAADYARLYQRRLKASTLLGLTALNAAERRRYECVEADPRLTFDDVMTLRRGAERWLRERLVLLPHVDVAVRRDSEAAVYAYLLHEGGGGTRSGPSGGRAARALGASEGGAGAGSKLRHAHSRRQHRGVPAADAAAAATGAEDVSKPRRSMWLLFGVGRKASVATGSAASASTRQAVPPSAAFRSGGSALDAADADGSDVTTDDLVSLYDSLGYEYEPASGTMRAKAGAEGTLAHAAVAANSGMPRSYVWLRVAVEVSRVAVTLQEHSPVASTGTSGYARGLVSLASSQPGSMAACGTLHDVSRLVVSRSIVGFDSRAVSWACGMDLGDVMVIDCSLAASSSNPASAPGVGAAAIPRHAVVSTAATGASAGIGNSTRGGLSGTSHGAGGAGTLVHRYIVFSDHSSSLIATPAPGLNRGAISGAAAGNSQGSQDASIRRPCDDVTEESICSEIAPLSSSASAATSQVTIGMSRRRLVDALALVPATGGGGLCANPVRAGWLSLRLVYNPSASGDEPQRAVAAASAPGALAARKLPHHPGSDDDDDDDDTFAQPISRARSAAAAAPMTPSAAAPSPGAARARGTLHRVPIASQRSTVSVATPATPVNPQRARQSAAGRSASQPAVSNVLASARRGAAGFNPYVSDSDSDVTSDGSSEEGSEDGDSSDDTCEDSVDETDDDDGGGSVQHDSTRSEKTTRAKAAASADSPTNGWRAPLQLGSRPGAAASATSIAAPVPSAGGSADDSVFMRIRAAMRPLVVVWSPPYIRRVISWLATSDDLSYFDGVGSVHPSSLSAGATALQLNLSPQQAQRPPPRFFGSAHGTHTAIVFDMLTRYVSSTVLSASLSIEDALLSSRNRVDVRAHLSAPVLVVPQRVHAISAALAASGRPPSRLGGASSGGSSGGGLAAPAGGLSEQQSRYACPMLVVDLGSLAVASLNRVALKTATADVTAAALASSASSGSSSAAPSPQPDAGAAPAGRPEWLPGRISELKTRLLARSFDCVTLTASGISAMLATRAVVDPAACTGDDDEFDPRLHRRADGTGALVMLHGSVGDSATLLTGPTAQPTTVPPVTAARPRATATLSASRRSLQAASQLPARLSAAGAKAVRDREDPWGVAALGLPRVAWFRVSSHYLLRNCTLCVDVHTPPMSAVASEAASPVDASSLVAASGGSVLGSSSVAAAGSAPPVAPAHSRPLPSAFVRVHVDQVSLAVSTRDLLLCSGIGLAAAAPLVEMSLPAQPPAQPRPGHGGPADLRERRQPVRAASRQERRGGLSTLTYAPFDARASAGVSGGEDRAAAPPLPSDAIVKPFDWTAQLSTMAPIAASAPAAAKRTVVGSGGLTSPQQRDPTLGEQASAAAASLSVQPSTAVSQHALGTMLECTLSDVTLRFSASASTFATDGHGAGDAAGKAPFDVILTASGTRLLALSAGARQQQQQQQQQNFDAHAAAPPAPSSAFHISADSLMAYVGAGAAPRALLLQSAIRCYGHHGDARAETSGGTTARPIGAPDVAGASSAAPDSGLASSIPLSAAATRRGLSVTHMELSQTELCLVRRQQSQLAAVDISYSQQVNSSATAAPLYTTAPGTAMSASVVGNESVSPTPLGGPPPSFTSPYSRHARHSSNASSVAGFPTQASFQSPQPASLRPRGVSTIPFASPSPAGAVSGATYSSILAELKADATYLFAPLVVHVMLVEGAGSISPASSGATSGAPAPVLPAPISDESASSMRVFVRVGSVLVSVSPDDAASLIGLGLAVHVGAVTLVDDITRGIAGFLAPPPPAIENGDALLEEDELADSSDGGSSLRESGGGGGSVRRRRKRAGTTESAPLEDADSDPSASLDPDQADLALSALALSLRTSSLGTAAGARVRLAAARMIQGAPTSSSPGSGGLPAQAWMTSAAALLDDRAARSGLAGVASSLPASPAAFPELRLFCDRLLVTLHRGQSGNRLHTGHAAASTERTHASSHVLRLCASGVGARMQAGAVQLVGRLAVSFFNEPLATWEPALEPWAFGASLLLNGPILGESPRDAPESTLQVSLSGSGPLNVTLSSALLRSLPGIQATIVDTIDATSLASTSTFTAVSSRMRAQTRPGVFPPIGAAASPGDISSSASVGFSRARGRVSDDGSVLAGSNTRLLVGDDAGTIVSGAGASAAGDPGALAFAPFVLINDTGASVQIWKPESPSVRVGSRVGGAAPPMLAVVDAGQRLPISATYLTIAYPKQPSIVPPAGLAPLVQSAASAAASLGMLAHAVQPPDFSTATDAATAVTLDELPTEFKQGAFHPDSKSPFQQPATAVSSGGLNDRAGVDAAVTTLNLQVAGYLPLLNQPINSLGSTFVSLVPLASGAATALSGSVPLLRAGARSQDEETAYISRARAGTAPDDTAVLDEIDEALIDDGGDGGGDENHSPGGEVPAAATAAGAANDPLAAWRLLLRDSTTAAGAALPWQLELRIEADESGGKLVRLSSLVRVVNFTRIPVVVRALPGTSVLFVRRVGSAAGVREVPPDAAGFPATVDAVSTALATALHSASFEACARIAATRRAAAVSATRARAGSVGATDEATNESAASKQQLFRAQSRALMSAGLLQPQQSDTVSGAAEGGASTEPLTEFEISCWDGAACGLPLDRVLLPGGSWCVPSPYATNSRLFVKPAISVSALAPGLVPVNVAEEYDDGRTVLRTPLATVIKLQQQHHEPLPAPAVSLSSVPWLQAHESGSDSDDKDAGSSVFATNKPARGALATSVAPNRIPHDAAASTVDGDMESDTLNDGYEDEALELYAYDPRYDWSLFEGTEAPTLGGDAAPAVPSAHGRRDGSRRGMLARLFRGAGGTKGDSSPRSDEQLDDLSTMGVAVGIGLELLTHSSLMAIIHRITTSHVRRARNEAAAAFGEDSEDPNESESDDESDADDTHASFASHRSCITSQVAVCSRVRADAHDTVVTATTDAGGLLKGLGRSHFSGAPATTDAPLTGASDSGSAAVESLLQSHAFYYVAARVDMVALAPSTSRSGTTAAAAAPTHSHPGVIQQSIADREAEWLMRSAGARVTLVIRAPAELQNALPCLLDYEMGVPRTLAGSSSSSDPATGHPDDVGSGAQVGLATASGSKSSRFSNLFKRKTAASASAAAPATAAHAASSSTAAPSAPILAPELDPSMLVVSAGSLGPAQSLSLLFAHPDAPIVTAATVLIGGGRSTRGKLKQRMAAARYSRGLSVRFRIPGSGFLWSPWMGVWSQHDSPERLAATSLDFSASGGGSATLPTLSLPFSHAHALVSPLELRDGAGQALVLHSEHALTSAAGMLASGGGISGTEAAAALSAAHLGADGGGRLQRQRVRASSLCLTLYCRFWLCNASGLPLLYSSAVTSVGTSLASRERAIRSVKPAPGQAERVVEETWENQRFVMFRWGVQLMPTDRLAWSDRAGLSKVPRHPDLFSLPSPDWSWEGPWAVDMRGAVDPDGGWSYNFDFPHPHLGSNAAGWSSKRTPAHFVRRRRWVRVRAPPPSVRLAARALAPLLPRDGAQLFGGRDALGDDCGQGGTLIDDDSSGLLDRDDDDGQTAAVAPAPSTLLAMGVLLYGPDPACEDQSAVRVADSAWSLPFPLTTIGRPSLVIIRDRAIDGGGGSNDTIGTLGDAKMRETPVVADDGAPPASSLVTTRRQYELSVSCTPALAHWHDSTQASVFRRTLSVTLSPRFVFANLLDGHLAAAFAPGRGGGAEAPSGASFAAPGRPAVAAAAAMESVLQLVGMYVLQVTQAGPHGSDDGVALPHEATRAYLASVTSGGVLAGADSEYDIGAALQQRLLAANGGESADIHTSSPAKLGVRASALRVTAAGTVVPQVLSVPPGELSPFYWPTSVGVDGACDRVCLRVVRLVRKRTFASSHIAVMAGRGRRASASDHSASQSDADSSPPSTARASAAAAGIASDVSYRTVAVPVTEWSGALSIAQISEVPVRLSPVTTAATRALAARAGVSGSGQQAIDVVLRVTITAHHVRGTALVSVTADSGLEPITSLAVSEDSDLHTATANAVVDAAQEESGDWEASLRDSSSSEVAPLLWGSGFGEVTPCELVTALARQQLLLAPPTRRRDGRVHAHPVLFSAAAAAALLGGGVGGFDASSSLHGGHANSSVLAIAGSAQPPPPPLYRIDNHTLDSFAVTQLGVTGSYRPAVHVPARASVVFAWEEPEIDFDMVLRASASLNFEDATGTTAGPAVAPKTQRRVDAGDVGTPADGSAAESQPQQSSTSMSGPPLAQGSHLRLCLRPTTTPVVSAPAGAAAGLSSASTASLPPLGAATSAAAAAAYGRTLIIDLSSIAQCSSMELGPGRPVDEDASGGAGTAGLMSILSPRGGGVPIATIGAAAGGGRVARELTRRPLTYGAPVFMRARHADATLSLSRVYTGKAAWSVCVAPDGSLAVPTASPQHLAGSVRANSQAAHQPQQQPPLRLRAGDPVLTAQCCLLLDAGSASTRAGAPLGGGELSVISATAASAVPFVFESVSAAFGWEGFGWLGEHATTRRQPGGGPNARGRRAGGLEGLLSSYRAAAGGIWSEPAGTLAAASSAHALGALLQHALGRAGATRTPVRYGDLVMIRHDTVAAPPAVAVASSDAGATAPLSGGSGTESFEPDSLLAPVAATPLYLTCHKDGKVEWVQKEVALSVARVIGSPPPTVVSSITPSSSSGSLSRLSDPPATLANLSGHRAMARGAGSPASTAPSQPPAVACSVFLVVGGKPGAAVALAKYEPGACASSATAAAAAGGGRNSRGGGSAPRLPSRFTVQSRITEEEGAVSSDEAEESDHGTSPAVQRGSSSASASGTATLPRKSSQASTGSGRYTSAPAAFTKLASFGLLPIAFSDRLLECASSGDASGAPLGATSSIRQCRLPMLTPAGGTDVASAAAAASADGAANPSGRVMSAMQRRRMAARGATLSDDGSGAHSSAAAAVAIQLPSTPIPADVRAASSSAGVGSGSGGGALTAGNGGVPTLGSVLATQLSADDAFSAGGDDADSDGGADSDGDATDVTQSARSCRARIAAGASAPSPRVAAHNAQGSSLRAQLRSLRAAVLALPVLPVLPASCAFVACALTTQVLPPRVIAARVGFDGPTRVLTLQSHEAARHGAAPLSRHSSDSHLVPPPSSGEAAAGNPAAQDGRGPGAAPLAASSRLRVELSVALTQLSVSLVDSRPAELLLLTLEGVSSTLSMRHPYTTADLRVDEVQIDNPQPMAAHPVVLGRTLSGSQASAHTRTAASAGGLEGLPAAPLRPRPLLQASIVHQAHRMSPTAAAPGTVAVASSHSAEQQQQQRASGASSEAAAGSASTALIVHIPYASVLLQEVDLNVEEALLLQLLAMAPPPELWASASGSAQRRRNGAATDDRSDDLVVSRRRGGALLVGADLTSHAAARGSSGPLAFRHLRGLVVMARDRLAERIVQAATASSGGGGGSGVRGAGSAADRLLVGLSSQWVGTKKATALAARLRALSQQARAAAAHDLRRLACAQRRAGRVVKQGASKTSAALRTAAQATRRELALLRERGGADVGPRTQAAAAGQAAGGSQGDSGPPAAPSLAGVGRFGSLSSLPLDATQQAAARQAERTRAKAAAAARRREALRRLAADDAVAAAGGAGEAAPSAHAPGAAGPLRAAPPAGALAELRSWSSSDSVDTVAALGAEVQWWWAPRRPLADGLDGVPGSAGGGAAQLFLQHLALQPIAINLTFTRDHLGARGSGGVRGSGDGGRGVGGLAGDGLSADWGGRSGAARGGGGGGGGSLATDWLTSPLLASVNALGVMALSLHRAPLRLTGLELVHVLASPRDLARRIAQHYVSCGLGGVYKVLLSADVLGNPVGVVSALGAGVRDFFLEPAAATSPLDFTRALGTGSVSLVGHTVMGLGLGLGGLAASVGRGVSVLALDDEYTRARAARAAAAKAGQAGDGPASASSMGLAHGLLEGSRELGRGVLQGLAGVVLDPMRGAEADGAAGFLRGVGTGVAGLVVKPVVGVLDLAARTTEGMVAQARALTRDAGAGGGVGGGGGAAGGALSGAAAAALTPRRHARLLWGIDRVVIPVDPLHGVIVSLLRAALEAAAASLPPPSSLSSSASSRRAAAAAAASSEAGSRRDGQPLRATDASRGGVAAAAPATAGSSAASRLATRARDLLSDVSELVSGREAALRAASARIAGSYMHHVAWPGSPYLLVVSTRALVLARVSSRGAIRRGGGGGGAQLTQVVTLCWHAPTQTHAALHAAQHEAFALQRGAVGGGDGRGGGGGSGGGGGAGRAAAAVAGAAATARAAAPAGLLCGHAAYVHLLRAMADLAAATATAAATAAAVPPPLRRLASLPPGPSHVMAVDAAVTASLAALAARAAGDPLWDLPAEVIAAMTGVPVGAPAEAAAGVPRPPPPSQLQQLLLHFGDAMATLANVRPDEAPQANVAAIASALAYIDSAWLRHQQGQGQVAQPLTDAQAARVLRLVLARSAVDRPVLCWLLARVWQAQAHGASPVDERAGAALALFQAAALWGLAGT